MKFIRARICTTGRASSAFCALSKITHEPIFFTIPVISSCSKWTICNSSTYIILELKHSMSKTPNSGLTVAAVFMAVTKNGSIDRGRFRSLGDGQIDFKQIFSKLAHYDYAGWATLEWECCVKDSEAGAREGAQFIARHILPVTERAFDDFSKVADESHNRALLGIASPHDSV